MIFCTDTHFIHKYSNVFIINCISFTKSLILPTIIKQSIRKILQKDNSHFISAASTKQPY